MTTKRVVAAAFRQLASMMILEEALEHIHSQHAFKAYFSRLPWDEKVFKIADTGENSGDASCGNWMARISKDGPRLTLSPTIDITKPPQTITGTQFWRQLIATVQAEYNSAHLGNRHRDAASEQGEGLAGNRWNKHHFLKWTQAPAPVNRKAERPAVGPTARQVYALYYQ